MKLIQKNIGTKYLCTHNHLHHPAEEFFILALLALTYKRTGHVTMIVLWHEGNLDATVERFSAGIDMRGDTPVIGDKRTSGAPYGKLGRVWQLCGRALCASDEIFQAFEARYIEPLEANVPNNILLQSLDLTHGWTARHKTPQENLNDFNKRTHAIEEMLTVILTELKYEYSLPRIAVLEEQGLVDKTIAANPRLSYVVYPANPKKTTWMVRALKGPFPDSLRMAGLEKIKELTGAEDALSFQDSGKFAKAKSADGARKIAEAALVAA